MPSLQNKIFFGMIHYILSEQKNVPWIIKTSLINVTGLSDEVSNNLYQKESKIDDILAYITDAKPYRTKFDQFLEKFNSSNDSMSIQGDRQYIDSDNYIVIPNKVEKNNIEVTMRFDAVSSDPDFAEFRTNYYYHVGDIIRYNMALYKCNIEHLSEEGEIEEDASKPTDNRRFIELNGRSESNSALWDTNAATRICALETRDLDEIHEILHTNFKALSIDGGRLDLNRFGYEAYAYDELNYDAPSISNVYCLVKLTEDTPYNYTKEFIKVGVTEYFIETSDQYTLTADDIVIKATYQGRTRYIQDYYMTFTGMITLYDGIRKEEKIDILVTPKDSMGNVMEEYVKEYIYVGYDFMTQSSIDFEYAYKDISTRSFPIPSSQFTTKNVRVYITNPNGDTEMTEDFTFDANSSGKSITITNESLLTEFSQVMISVCDYSYIYDKSYTYADVYGETNNIHIIDGDGFLRPYYDPNHPAQLIYAKGVDTLSVSKMSDNAGLSGGPYISYQVFDTTPKQYNLSIIPQCKDAIIPFNNGYYAPETYITTNTETSVYPIIYPNNTGYCSCIAFANGGDEILYEEQDFYMGGKIKIDIADFTGSLSKSQISIYLNGDTYTDFSVRNNAITLNEVDIGTWYRITVFAKSNSNTVVSKKTVVANDTMSGENLGFAYYNNIMFDEDGKIANYPYMEYITYEFGGTVYPLRMDTTDKTIEVYSYNKKMEALDKISPLNYTFINNTLNLVDWNTSIYTDYIIVMGHTPDTIKIDDSFRLTNTDKTYTDFNLSNHKANIIIDKFTAQSNVVTLPNTYYNLFIFIDKQLANMGIDYKIENNNIVFNDTVNKEIVYMYTNVENNSTPSNTISLQQIDMFGNHKIATLDTSRKIYLKRDLNLGDNIIYLNSIDNISKPIISAKANEPGMIIVNSEIIEFWKYDDASKTVSQIRRGRYGTGIQKVHPANSEVIDFSNNSVQNITPAVLTAKYVINMDDKTEVTTGYTIPGEILSSDAVKVWICQKISLLTDITTQSTSAIIDADNIVKPGEIQISLPYTDFVSPDVKDKLAITLAGSYKVTVTFKSNMTVDDVIELLNTKLKGKYGFKVTGSNGFMTFETQDGVSILLENVEGQPLQKITGGIIKGTTMRPTVTMNGVNGIKINGVEIIWGAFHYSIAEMVANPIQGSLADIMMSILNSDIKNSIRVIQNNNKLVLISLKNEDIDIESIGDEDCLEIIGLQSENPKVDYLTYNDATSSIRVYNDIPSSIGSIWVDGDKINFTKITELTAPVVGNPDGDIVTYPTTKGRYQIDGLTAAKNYSKDTSYAIASWGYKMAQEQDYVIKGDKVIFLAERASGEVILISNKKN